MLLLRVVYRVILDVDRILCCWVGVGEVILFGKWDVLRELKW